LIVVDLAAGHPMPEPQALDLDPETLEGTRRILDQVWTEGDGALVQLTATHDGADVSDRLEVPRGVGGRRRPNPSSVLMSTPSPEWAR